MRSSSHTSRAPEQAKKARELTELYRERDNLYKTMHLDDKETMNRLNRFAELKIEVYKLERWFTSQPKGKQFIRQLLVDAI